MELRRLLRTLILVEIGLLFLSIAIGIVAERFLPEPLRAYLNQESDGLTGGQIVLLLVALPLLGALVVSWIGLWRTWRAARLIYVITMIAALLLEALAGPWIYSGPGAALATLQSVISGMIVALVFLTPLAAAFGRPPAAPPGGFGVDMRPPANP